MNRKGWKPIAVSCLVALMASNAVSFTQQPAIASQQPKAEDGKPVKIKPGPDKPGSPAKVKIAPVGPETLKFVGVEFTFNKLVKGAPYSATAVTESTQKLSDGNEITRRMEARIYRDSEGRTRREQTLDSLAKYTTVNEGPRIIFIDDPVAAVQFTLDPLTRTAYKQKGPARPLVKLMDQNIGPLPGPRRLDKPVPPEPRVFAKEKRESPAEGKEPASLQKQATEPAGDRNKGDRNKLDTQRRTESLGKQMFDGVEAEGTRTTLTIPAGEIGNRLPIEVIDERWYSPDLQILVMSRHSDPRSAETLYRLTNIDRSEPNHSLFEMPPDYRWAPSAIEPEKREPRSAPQARPMPKPARDG